MADDAIQHINQLNATAPDKPFFVYYCPGGSHAPHQPTKEWIDKFTGKFDMGWNKLREEIFANQKRLGVIPPDTQLTPWPDGQAEFGGASLPKWDTLTAEEKKLFARQAEVFAAYVAYTDHEIGRVIQAVEDMGKLDNTLIIYICGDNGTSAEGSTLGTPFDLAALQAVDIPVKDQMKYYDVWGLPETQPHMSVAWSWAFDTPFKWTKQVASHFGGTRQGMCIAWPGHIKDAGGVRTQFHHLIDIVPTILEATGIQAPSMVDGVAQRPIEGVSMAYTWNKENADAPSKRTTQYFEMFGNRALYHEGWIAVTTPPAPPWLMGAAKFPNVVDGYNWELYNIDRDYSEYNDLAAENPDKLRELQELFWVEAAKFNVLPLDNDVLGRVLTPRPSYTAGRNTFVYKAPITGIPLGDAPNCLAKSFTITADIQVPDDRAEGVIVTEGGKFGGFGLYLQEGKPRFSYSFLAIADYLWQSDTPLAKGKHTLVFDFTYDGPGAGKGGAGVLKVDGKTAGSHAVPHTIPFLLNLGESLDIGSDTRTGVGDYTLPFHFTGTIDAVTFKLGPSQLTDADHAAKATAMRRVND